MDDQRLPRRQWPAGRGVTDVAVPGADAHASRAQREDLGQRPPVGELADQAGEQRAVVDLLPLGVQPRLSWIWRVGVAKP